MPAAAGNAPSIESVDAFARQLYRRTRSAGSGFVDLAIAVRNLHTALQHLLAEVQDPDSPFRQPDPSNSDNRNAVYARQLTSLIEDSDFALKQVNTILEKYGNAVAKGDLDRAERSRKIDLTRGDVVSQRMKIDIFLDTVQLHNPTETQLVLEKADDQQLDMIKNKVDTIANRLFRTGKAESPVDLGEDELWRSFKAELEREGFSSEVLRKNKEVLRAYIRELESHQPLGGGMPPSVRGLLAWDAQPQVAGRSAPDPTRNRDSRSNSDTNPLSSERRRRAPTSGTPESLSLCHRASLPVVSDMATRPGFERCTSSESSDSEPSPSSQIALISTRDLMSIDRYEADKVAVLMTSSHLSPARPTIHAVSPGRSPGNRYLTPGGQPLIIPGSVHHPHDGYLSVSPPFGPDTSPLSPAGTSPTGSASGTSWNIPVVPASAPAGGSDTLQYQVPRRPYSRLAPDSEGQGIPLDATWTKIDRRLVSSEVLEKAGVRYEARPTFVAVLGVLTRDMIQVYAKESLELRKARSLPTTKGGHAEQQGHDLPRRETYGDRERRRGKNSTAQHASDSDLSSEADSIESSKDDDDGDAGNGLNRSHGRHTPRNYIPGKNKDNDKGTKAKAYPVVVSPPASVNGDTISPASAVLPKPILKNRNPNHVRFDRSGPKEISPTHYSDQARRDRDRERRRGDHDRDRDWDRDRARTDRPRERLPGGDRDRDRDPDSRPSRRYHDRDRDRDRSRDPRNEDVDDRAGRRSALRETASAIGFGSAAATLLSVLAEAAQHL